MSQPMNLRPANPHSARTLKLPAEAFRLGSSGAVVASIKSFWRAIDLGWTAFIEGFFLGVGDVVVRPGAFGSFGRFL